jgi:sugar phosphate isomerase/epimerase
MKLSVTTMGCPGWNLDTLLTNIKSYGYDGIDFRGLQGKLDITLLPEFTTDLAATAKRIKSSGLEVFGISSSICICEPSRRERDLDEAKRTIALAQAIGAKNTRVMGYGPIDTTPKSELVKIAKDRMAELLALPDAGKLTWNFETHDHWIKGADTRLILDAVPAKNFGAIWDMGALASTGETPEQTHAFLHPRINYVHLSDSIADPAVRGEGKEGGRRYAAPGQGQLPLAHSINILKQHGYDGWLMFEHEKHWLPEIEEPEVAFPAFMAWARPLIGK